MGGSKIAAQFLVKVLAKSWRRGITVNSILPIAIEGVGIFAEGVPEQFRSFISSFRPMTGMGQLSDVANAAECFASELSEFVSGQHLLVSCGAFA